VYSLRNEALNHSDFATLEQRLIKLQTKAVKLVRPFKPSTFLEESFLLLNILCLPNLCTLSLDKFMHSQWRIYGTAGMARAMGATLTGSQKLYGRN